MGFSERELRGLVDHGDLARPFRGVYVDGRTSLSTRSRLRAAILAVNAPAFFSHRTGAALRGYRAINPWDIHITVVADHTPTIPGLTLHRVASEPAEVSAVAGLRVATLPLLLLQFATVRDPELTGFIARAAGRQTLDPGRMEEFFANHARTPGIARLKHALTHYRPSPEYNSTLEADVHAWLAQHPEVPTPDDTNVRIGPHEWDAVWHGCRVVMEIDSRDWHSAMEQKENDNRKDAFIQRRGYRILRITGWRFRYDREGFLTDLLALTGHAEAA